MKSKLLFALFFTIAISAQSQSVSVDAKTSFINYLVDPAVSGSLTKVPTSNEKGACYLRCYCKPNFFGPFADTGRYLAQRWDLLMENYVIGDSSMFYDSLFILFYADGHTERHDCTIRLKTRIVETYNHLTEPQRLQAVVGCLPFRNVATSVKNDSIDIRLHFIPGYTPQLEHDDRNITNYAGILGYVIWDYANNPNNRHLGIKFFNDVTGEISVFSLDESDIKKLSTELLQRNRQTHKPSA
jgi:hypothetical protein